MFRKTLDFYCRYKLTAGQNPNIFSKELIHISVASGTFQRK